MRFKFNVSNNQAEYEALIAGIEWERDIRLTKIVIHSDSQLIVNQVKGEYGVLNSVLMKYCNLARRVLKGFEFWELVQIDRTENSRADELSRSAGSKEQSSVNEPLIEYVETPAIDRQLVLEIVEAEKNWVVEMNDFLGKEELPPDEEKSRLIKVTSPRFTVQDGMLYRKSFSKPLLRCVELSMVQRVLFEIHEGVCGGHPGARTLADKVLFHGYYWLSLRKDAEITRIREAAQSRPGIWHFPPCGVLCW